MSRVATRGRSAGAAKTLRQAASRKRDSLQLQYDAPFAHWALARSGGSRGCVVLLCRPRSPITAVSPSGPVLDATRSGESSRAPL